MQLSASEERDSQSALRQVSSSSFTVGLQPARAGGPVEEEAAAEGHTLRSAKLYLLCFRTQLRRHSASPEIWAPLIARVQHELEAR